MMIPTESEYKTMVALAVVVLMAAGATVWHALSWLWNHVSVAIY